MRRLLGDFVPRWPAEWSRGQWLLRAVVPLAVLAAVLFATTAPVAVIVALLLGALAALRPEGGAGTLALVLVVAAWVLSDPPLWAALPAAAALLAAHLALQVAAHGPGAMPVDPALVRRWAGRGLLVLPAAAVALLPVVLPAYSWVWTLALLAAAAVGWAAVVALSRVRD